MFRGFIRTRLGWAVALVLTASCTSPGPSPLDYGVRQVQQRDRRAVFDAVEVALVDLGHRIERRDPAAGVLVTQPVEGGASEEPARRGVGLSSRGRTRRVTEVRVEETAEAMKVYCKVLMQEQATQAHRMFAFEQSGSDTPGQSAIDRDAATTSEQNTVWRTLRRDKAAERDILAAIVQRTGGESP